MCSACGLDNSQEGMNGLNPESEAYAKNLENSLYSLGNNYRAKKVIEKLENGETVYVAAIGGSVTEGAGPKDASGKELWELGYAYQFRDKLMEKYPSATIKFDGAGVSGTPSAMGVVRYEKDVVDVLGASPDILIIEFAVNDGGECTSTRGFERMIRWVLEEKEAAVVIPVYAYASYENNQATMIPVADFYKLPQVSIKNAIKASGSDIDTTQGGMYLTDYAHPTKEGHNFMADCIMNVFEKSAAAEADEKIDVPATYKNEKAFEDFHTIYSNTSDANVQITKGNWADVDENTYILKKGGTSFPNNFHHTKGTDPLSVKINCKSMIVVFKHQSKWLPEEFGKAEFYVDGKLVKTFDGNTYDKDGNKTGWNDHGIEMIIDEDSAADHIIEVKMAEGEENKGFTICAFGYSK